MRVAVVGAGRIGGNVAARLAAAGHDVAVTSTRDPEALARRGAELGATAQPGVRAAVADAEVVVDTTNQFGPGPKPPDGETAAAFNAAWVCGDDEAARAVTCGLVRDAGSDPVGLGGTATCAVMEAPRREGAVHGEELRRPEVDLVAAAVAAGRPIPPVPAHA